MWEDLECHLERIRQQDFYKRMNKKQQASLIQFAAIFIIQQATAKTFNEKFATKDNFLEINHESGWQGYAYGFREPINYKPNWDYDTGYELCKMNVSDLPRSMERLLQIPFSNWQRKSSCNCNF